MTAFARRRLGVAAAAILVVVVLVVAIVGSGGGGGGPTGAARLVPADALAYVQLDNNANGATDRAAGALGRALPTLSAQVVTRLETGLVAIRAAGLEPGSTRARWLGDQAAIAILGGTYPPVTVELLAVADPAGADAFARRLTNDAKPTSYRGVNIRTGRRGAAAIDGGFLLFGPARQVKAMIDTGIGDGGSLSSSPDFASAIDALPAGGLAQAYLSARGTAAVLAGSPLAFLETLASGSGVRDLAVEVTPANGALEVTARSAFDSAAGDPPPLAGLRSFDAKLPQTLSADSLAYVGVGSSGARLESSLRGLGGVGGAISTAFLALVPGQKPAALRRLLPVLGTETALVVQSGQGTAATKLVPPTAGLVSTGVTPDASKGIAGKLVGRVSGSTLRVAGSAVGLTALSNPHGSLDTTAGFSNVMVGFQTTPTLEAYLDVASVVPLFEAAGLAENPAYASFATEIRRLRALGIVVSSDPGSVTVQARLTFAPAGGSAGASQ